MKQPESSIISITGPQDILTLIEKAYFVSMAPLQIYCEDKVERVVRWMSSTIASYNYRDYDVQSGKPKGRVIDVFSRVVRFPIPDDYGEFPDTTGYESGNFENMASDMEDPALLKFMMRGIDCVDEANETAGKRCDMKYDYVENFMSIPKFGSRVFLCVGVTMVDEQHESRIIQVPTTIEKIQRKDAFSKVILNNQMEA